jgi:hypothetical protein
MIVGYAKINIWSIGIDIWLPNVLGDEKMTFDERSVPFSSSSHATEIQITLQDRELPAASAR